jgi:hypothetical protein
MSLEETLHATFETLRQAVGETLARQVSAANDQVRAVVELERRLIFEQAEQTAKAAADLRAAADVTAASAADVEKIRQAAYDEGFDAGRADGWDTGRQHGAIEGRHDALAEATARELAGSERLADAVKQIEGASAVADMLDVLLRCAVRETARAAILIVRGSELQGWKFIGFGARTENPTEFRQSVVGSGVIEEAIRTGSAAYTHGPVRVPAPAFAELPLGRKAVGVPLIVRNRAVAVVYADQGPSPHPQDVHAPAEGVTWPVFIEVMTRHASRCLEAATVLRSAQSGSSAETRQEPRQPVGAATGQR